MRKKGIYRLLSTLVAVTLLVTNCNVINVKAEENKEVNEVIIEEIVENEVIEKEVIEEEVIEEEVNEVVSPSTTEPEETVIENAEVVEPMNVIAEETSEFDEDTYVGESLSDTRFAPLMFSMMSLADEAPSNLPQVIYVQNSNPWSTSSNTDVLKKLGITYKTIKIKEFSAALLEEYPVMILGNSQTMTMTEYINLYREVETYVANGGVAILGLSKQSGSVLKDAPFGIKVIDSDRALYNIVSDPTHPIATGELTDNLVLNNNSFRGSGQCNLSAFDELSLPADCRIITRSKDTSNPTLIEFPYGKGTAILSTITWEFSYEKRKSETGNFALTSLDDYFMYGITLATPVNLEVEMDLTATAPETVQSTDNFTVSCLIENTGDVDSSVVNVNITIPEGLKVIEGTTNKTYESIEAHTSEPISITLAVEDIKSLTADETDFTIQFDMDYANPHTNEIKTVSVEKTIKVLDAGVSVTLTMDSPDEFLSSDSLKVTASVNNDGRKDLSNVKVSIILPENLVLADLGNEVVLPSVVAGESLNSEWLLAVENKRLVTENEKELTIIINMEYINPYSQEVETDSVEKTVTMIKNDIFDTTAYSIIATDVLGGVQMYVDQLQVGRPLYSDGKCDIFTNEEFDFSTSNINGLSRNGQDITINYTEDKAFILAGINKIFDDLTPSIPGSASSWPGNDVIYWLTGTMPNTISNSNLMVSIPDVKTDENIVMYSKNGDISIYANSIDVNGIIYAPNGTVILNASYVKVTGTIIAKKVLIYSQNVNLE